MDATVVELDPLPDPVRPAAKDHDLFLGALADFVDLVVVGRIVVGRVGFELGRAGVDEAVGGNYSLLETKFANVLFLQIPKTRDLPVRKAERLRLLEKHLIIRSVEVQKLTPNFGWFLIGINRVVVKAIFLINQLLQLPQKPRIDLREIVNLLDAEAGAQGVADEENPLGVGRDELLLNDVARWDRWAGR